jgi:lantibiotic leader peptide-processing serine protease
MHKRVGLLFVAAILIGILISGCDTFLAPKDALAPMSAKNASHAYLVVFAGNDLPQDLSQLVTATGGTVKTRFDNAGAVLVTTQLSSFASDMKTLPGVTYVIPDVRLNWIPDDTYTKTLSVSKRNAKKHSLAASATGNDDPYLATYQWNMQAINAAGAWDAGYTGAGVRVAVLDTGIDPTHPDLEPNLNTALSTSFVPDEPYINDDDGHGTHVAGIIAAARNSYGVVGVAPDAELVTVKVLDHTGTGDFSWLISGLLYANAVGADVANVSLGAYLPRSGFLAEDGTWIGANEVAGLVNLLTRVINYVTSNGTLVVAAAGNDAADLTGDASWISIPAECGSALAISATGPLGWWADHSVSLDTPASIYTDYGTGVDYSAPGGNVDPVLFAQDTDWWYDLVFSTYPGGWAWMAGTSQACPHVAGVAALVLQSHPGASPSQVESIISRSSDDLGKPGRDEWYGRGRVNAAQAVQ